MRRDVEIESNSVGEATRRGVGECWIIDKKRSQRASERRRKEELESIREATRRGVEEHQATGSAR